MIAFVSWLLVVELLGLIALPLTRRLFRRLPDRGHGVTKPLAVLLVGLAHWLGTAYGLLRNDTGGAILAVGAIAVLAAFAGRPRFRLLRRLLAVCRHARPMQPVIVEIVFLLAFGSWTILRAFDPAAHHTEQSMDLLLLSAVSNDGRFPPEDPWLAGQPVSYYYVGYWILGTLARLAGQRPEVAYNLGQACWFGLLVSGCYSIGFNLTALAPCCDRRRLTAVAGGLLTAVAVAFASNLHGLHAGAQVTWGMVRRAAAPYLPPDAATAGWWWWGSSRVLQDTDVTGAPIEIIDEFPFFSYLLGDDHPHLLAMPFALVVISLALTIWLQGSGGDEGTRGPRRLLDRVLRAVPLRGKGLAILVSSLGGVLVINPWDFPTAWGLLVLTYLLRGRRGARPSAMRGRFLETAAFASLLALGALVLALPYVLSARSFVRGVVPNLFHPTPARQLLVMFGVFVPGLFALLWSAWRRSPPAPAHLVGWLVSGVGVVALSLLTGAAWALGSPAGHDWLIGMHAPADTGGRIGVMLQRWRTGWPTALSVAAATATTLSLASGRFVPRTPGKPADRPRHDGNAAHDLVLIVCALALGLVLVPEVMYVWDAFGTRMNTIFKLYYQAWLLFAVAAAYGTILTLRARGPEIAIAIISVGIVTLSLLYPASAVHSRVATSGNTGMALDALTYLKAEAPDELAAIQWVRAHTRPDARIVQTVGASYHAEQCRLSVATGRATLLGWEGHELQWRGPRFLPEAQARAAAVAGIYAAPSREVLRGLLARWAIDYVYVGPQERAKYGITAETDARFGEAMDRVFDRGNVRIYRRRG